MKLKTKYSKEVVIIQSDLSHRDEPKKVFELAPQGRHSGLINNAGIGFYGRLRITRLSNTNKQLI